MTPLASEDGLWPSGSESGVTQALLPVISGSALCWTCSTRWSAESSPFSIPHQQFSSTVCLLRWAGLLYGSGGKGITMMNTTKHGLTIGLERVGTLSYLSMKASGMLTHADYEIITPVIESALTGVTAI